MLLDMMTNKITWQDHVTTILHNGIGSIAKVGMGFIVKVGISFSTKINTDNNLEDVVIYLGILSAKAINLAFF